MVDLSKSSLLSKLPEAEGVITSMRSGKLPHSGLRLVFEVSGPVTIQTSAASPSGDAGHRLILDIAGPAASGVAKTVAVTPTRSRGARWPFVPRMRPVIPVATS